MKTIILVLLSFSVFGQIDYPRGLEFISTKNSEVTITWIKEASKDVPLYFNQQIAFVNAENDKILNSKVLVTINHNNRHFKAFEFIVGDGRISHIYTINPIKLKKGDNVTLNLKLISNTENENYVFSIFDNKSPVRTISVTSTNKKQPLIKEKKEFDYLKRTRRNRTLYSIFTLITH